MLALVVFGRGGRAFGLGLRPSLAVRLRGMSKRAASEALAPEAGDGVRLTNPMQLKKKVAASVDQREPSARDPRGLGDPSLRREEGAGKRVPKRKLALLLGYRGANYYGLQKQNAESGLPTIELALQEALNAVGAVHEANQGDLSKIGWSRSARTDKRVSAARQVVSAKLEVEDDDVAALVAKVNGALPPDIRVFDAVRVVKSFNCKQACDRRRYTYLLPSCVLAPDAVIDAAFAAVGYGPDRVAACQAAAAEAKARGAHPMDWKLDDAAAAAVADELAAFRAGADVLSRLRAFLAAYVGTRRYHNFTNKLKPTDSAAQRFIVSFTADAPTYPSGDASAGAEWVKLDVVGQSFLMHMIRKMVAVAAEAARVDKGDPTAVLDGLTSEAHEIPLQLVPGDGLYLGSPVFDTYNKFKATAADRPKLEWNEGHPAFEAIERFRLDVVESGIVDEGKAAAVRPWVTYLWQLRVFGFALAPDDAVPVPNPAPEEESDDDDNDGKDA